MGKKIKPTWDKSMREIVFDYAQSRGKKWFTFKRLRHDLGYVEECVAVRNMSKQVLTLIRTGHLERAYIPDNHPERDYITKYVYRWTGRELPPIRYDKITSVKTVKDKEIFRRMKFLYNSVAYWDLKWREIVLDYK